MCADCAVRDFLIDETVNKGDILDKSAYERIGVSRGADPASNGPFHSEGYFEEVRADLPQKPR
jgi:hypothetical protein